MIKEQFEPSVVLRRLLTIKGG